MNNLLGVKVLPQIDVKYLQTAFRSTLQKSVDGILRNLIPLCQRSPTYGTAVLGRLFNIAGKRNIVPCYAFLDVVGGHSLNIEYHLYRSCREIYTRHNVLQPLSIERF